LAHRFIKTRRSLFNSTVILFYSSSFWERVSTIVNNLSFGKTFTFSEGNTQTASSEAFKNRLQSANRRYQYQLVLNRPVLQLGGPESFASSLPAHVQRLIEKNARLINAAVVLYSSV
jgi:hypothetical protein